MENGGKAAFDEGVTIIAGEFGYSGDGPFALSENTTQETETAEDESEAPETGVEMAAPEGDTITQPPDGGLGWLMVFAVTTLISLSTVLTSLQTETLKFYKQVNTTETLYKESAEDQKLNDLVDRILNGEEKLYVNLSESLAALNRSQDFEQLLMGRQKTLTPNTVEDKATLEKLTGHVTTVQDTIYSIFGIFSATLILIIGYRWASSIGSLLLMIGFLATIYSNGQNLHLIAFIYGVLPAIGRNLVKVSTTVAVLEYFQFRRLLALIITQMVTTVITMILDTFLGLLMALVGMTDWMSCLKVQTVIAAVMVVFSLILKPLKLRMKDDRGSFVSKVFGIDSLRIYKNPRMYLFALLWFSWEGGYTTILAKLPSFKGLDLIPFISIGQLLLIALGAAMMIGSCVPCCCIPGDVKVKVVLIILAVQCFISAVFNLLPSYLYNFIFAIVFSGVLGLLKGMTSPLFEYAIPLVVGEEHLVVGTGVLITGQALASLTIGSLAADEIHEKTGKVDGCFYLAAGMFILGFVSAVVYLILLRHNSNKIKIQGAKPNVD